MQLHQPRLAEMVASILRDRILSGELQDGDALPRQEDLLEEFHVSKPSLREALRILEAEGLIAVRRGNRGGAIVHIPKAENAAYTIALVLQFRHVPLSDLSDGLQQIEPICAVLCAEREDRHSAVLPELHQIHEQVAAAVDDEVEFTRLSRRFHEQLVASCGNETLILVVGALETVWSQHEQDWAARATAAGEFPDRQRRRSGIRAHERLLEQIDQGDARGTAKVAQRHLDESQRFALSEAANATPISIRASRNSY